MTLEKTVTINPFGGKENGKKPELVNEIVNESDALVEKIFEKYHTSKPNSSPIQLEILSPLEINLFLQKLIQSESNPSDSYIGFFLSKLIQTSYDAGYSNFVLTTGDAPINMLGYQLKGTSERKLEMIVKGNVGWRCGNDATHCLFSIEGGAGDLCGDYSSYSIFSVKGHVEHYCGSGSEHSVFSLEQGVGNNCGSDSHGIVVNVIGDAGYNCGFRSKQGVFTIYGDVGNYCGSGSSNHTQSKQSTFTIYGSAGSCCGKFSQRNNFIISEEVGADWALNSRNNLFILLSKETYEKMQKNVPEGNNVIYGKK